MADVSWIRKLLGPLNLYLDGESTNVPARTTINFIGDGVDVAVEDNAAEDRTDITLTAAGGATATGTGFLKFISGAVQAAAAKVPLGDTNYVSGYVGTANGGLGADNSATSGIPKFTAGSVSYATAPSGALVGDTDTQTLTNKTISGASNTLTVRLASDVSGTLPVANGGTGITSLGTGVATWLGTPSGENLASALTTALPASKGGTGITSLGTGVATALGTAVEGSGAITLKTYVDGLLGVNTVTSQSSVNGANANFDFALSDSAEYTVQVFVVGVVGSKRGQFVLNVRCYTSGGSLTVQDVFSVTETPAGVYGWTCTASGSGLNLRITCTGGGSETVVFYARANATGTGTASLPASVVTESAIRGAMATNAGSLPLNSQKITGLATPTASTDAATKGYVDGVTAYPVNDFRLTLESGVQVSTTDQTSKTTIYLTPCGRGNRIGLYSSGAWSIIQSAEVSLALGTITSGKNYDVFAYNSSGTVTLEMLAWTNDTTRATALTTQDGVYVKTGDATRRYLGTFRTTSTTTTEDSATKRFLWNQYNQTERRLFVRDTTDSWTYGTASWRQARGSSANQVEYVTGDAALLVKADLHVVATHDTGSQYGKVGIGVDSTSATSANLSYYFAVSAGMVNMPMNAKAMYSGHPGLGYHYLAWLEQGAGGAGVQTWYGDAGVADGSLQSGMLAYLVG